MAEAYKKEIVQRMTKSLLDIQLLRLIQIQPLWGYRIKKKAEEKLHTKLRHGALYPKLNSLEKKGFLISRKQLQGRRVRKVYTITEKGKEYLEAYFATLKDQIDGKDLK